MKDSRFISFISKEDYLNYTTGFFPIYYKESLDSETNGWTLDTGTNIAHIKTNVAYSGTLQCPLGLLNIGDQVKFSGEFIKIIGNVGAFLEFSENPNMTGTSHEEPLFFFETEENGRLNKRTFNLNIKKKGYYRLAIGTWQSSSSEYKMRNVAIELRTIVKNKEWLERLEDRIRKAVIRKENGIFKKRNDFAGDDCTVIESSADTLLVTFDKPFPPRSLRPAYQISGDYATTANNYIVKCDLAQGSGVNVRFFPTNPISNTPVKLTDLTNGIQFSIQLST